MFKIGDIIRVKTIEEINLLRNTSNPDLDRNWDAVNVLHGNKTFTITREMLTINGTILLPIPGSRGSKYIRFELVKNNLKTLLLNEIRNE